MLRVSAASNILRRMRVIVAPTLEATMIILSPAYHDARGILRPLMKQYAVVIPCALFSFGRESSSDTATSIKLYANHPLLCRIDKRKRLDTLNINMILI